MEKLNLNALRVFAMAARHGSFLRAAEALHVSHGAVSQRIRQLEADLGVVLFDRTPRGVSLTPKGRTYHAAVEEALAVLTAATADLSRSGHRVTLHLGPSFAAKWLMPRLGAFNARFPEIALTTEVHHTPLRRNLGRNEIALWPERTPAPNPAHHLRRLCRIRLVALCSPDFPRPEGPVETATLLSFPLLQDSHRRWERLIEDSGHAGPHTLLNFDRSALALDAAVQGHGVAIAPTYMAEADLRAGRLVGIWRGPAPSADHLFLSWSRHHARETPLRQTVAWILSEFGVEAAA
ncbi:LysR substrate-binding domain-containing protein [Celeribacter indicus]|uniref:LysR family transcriptional regulator n=1 Tax=Celeribacter indicus TaxID=1208324 RepID=A0A0B5E322_9RHOB|nr:LysR family transcriptional regulator [Celeribacter indicus]AJE46842.1 LysR family transcriptional regulator [Celeribacter indicus]SDW80543.1 transcriptional regulator, LysR family [Celeribacter indicus]